MQQQTSAETDYALVFASCASPKLIVAPAAPRFTITDVNQAYLDATMRTRSTLVGMALFEAMPDNPENPAADGISNLKASIERAIATRLPDRMALQQSTFPTRTVVSRSAGGTPSTRRWSECPAKSARLSMR